MNKKGYVVYGIYLSFHYIVYSIALERILTIIQQLWDFSLGVALKSRQNLITAVLFMVNSFPSLSHLFLLMCLLITWVVCTLH